MTAEIAVMNKLAVALAADSAVTVGQTKVHKTANKLFALSRHHPVGAMVFGNAELLGIPWETIVKIFRSRLGRRAYGTIQSYADSLVDFLDKEKMLISEAEQRTFFRGICAWLLESLRDKITKAVQHAIEERGRVTESEVRTICAEKVKNWHKECSEGRVLRSVPKSFEQSAARKYGSEITHIKKRTLEWLPLSRSSQASIKRAVIRSLTRGHAGVFSGVVLAGFGDKEKFPSLTSLAVTGKIANRLLYRDMGGHQISSKSAAYVTALAQSDVVTAFMNGIDPSRKKSIDQAMEQLLMHTYPQAIVDAIKGVNKSKRSALQKALEEAGRKVLQSLKKELDNQERGYSAPMVEVVAGLPKDELATMAETLVNLTAFKRKMSLGEETVGGPVDVVVISKGDGFIWVKRKHYFKPELNPQFFATHYDGMGGGKG